MRRLGPPCGVSPAYQSVIGIVSVLPVYNPLLRKSSLPIFSPNIAPCHPIHDQLGRQSTAAFTSWRLDERRLVRSPSQLPHVKVASKYISGKPQRNPPSNFRLNRDSTPEIAGKASSAYVKALPLYYCAMRP
jgi:hypothetical protein